jgi:hypothetical protein
MKQNALVLVGVILLFVIAYSSEKNVLATSATQTKGPETIILKKIMNKYEPVSFSHEMHTGVAENCAQCHHTPPGENLACSECHGAPFDPTDLNKPGLKGAYHRQCIGCHKDVGSGPTGCTDCHAKKSEKK